MEVKIAVRALSVALGKRTILDDISFDLPKGKNLCIIGKSGEGKSVLLKAMIGLVPKKNGQVLMDGKEIKENVERNVKKHNIAFSFQNDCIFDSMTILENLCFPLIKRNGLRKKEAVCLSEEILSKIGLPINVLNLYPSILSGGMKKRIALARTLITRPDIVFFDEPTTGLDPVTSTKITEIIRSYISQEGISSISVTHSLKFARTISDNIAMLHMGKIMWNGTTDALDSTDNRYVRAFLSYA